MNIFILAGGSGSRLWPFSRHMTPKQFLNLGSTHESLLQETCRRLEGLAHESQIRVIGSKFHEYELKQQLQQVYPKFPEENLLLEPVGRNTAPAVLWGLNLLSVKDLQDPLLILPADHLIGDLKSFREAVSKAEDLCRSGFIVTFGIKPERPETGYGYLKSGSPLDHGYRLERFVEKPDLATAERYLAEGGYYWNAGMLVIKASVWLQELGQFRPDILHATAAALERAEVAVVLFDVTEPISEADIRIVQLALDSGRALVLAFNKWDMLDEERRIYLEKEIESELAHVDWAPRVNLSALTGRHLEKLVPALELALSNWDKRIPTGKLNAFLQELQAANPHPIRGGKQPRILFGTQAAARPPKFVLFASGFLEAGYRRFIVRKLRELYGFDGTPVEIGVRVREKRSR